MADTLYTSDGKMHVLLGSTTLVSLIREYMGDDAANAVAELEKNDAYERVRADSDMDAYEASLDHLHRQASSWVEQIDHVVRHALMEPRKYPRAKLISLAQDLRKSINKEI